MVEILTKQKAINEIVREAKRLDKEERELLLKELRIRRLIVENKPIVRNKKAKVLSLEEINKIKHLSRDARAE